MKAKSLGAIALSLVLSSGGCTFSGILVPKANYLVENAKLITVDMEKRVLKFFENGELKKEFPVRIGKAETPTPIGEGHIYIKREQMVFRYVYGPRKGKIIRWSKLSDGKLIEMPYKDMRGLGFTIPGCDPYKYHIHSTTEEDTIGQACSHGCVGMKIEDMLELYPLVEVGTKIIIEP